eukprot:5320030-Pleurochrysis_carterae.AAC.2
MTSPSMAAIAAAARVALFFKTAKTRRTPAARATCAQITIAVTITNGVIGSMSRLKATKRSASELSSERKTSLHIRRSIAANRSSLEGITNDVKLDPFFLPMTEEWNAPHPVLPSASYSHLSQTLRSAAKSLRSNWRGLKIVAPHIRESGSASAMSHMPPLSGLPGATQ